MNPNTLSADGRLWANHPATPAQRKKHGQRTQKDVLASLLRDARQKGAALELPEIMRAGIAQHGARFNELRSGGFVIENELERAADGRILSRYWLRHDPELEGRRHL